MLKNFSLIAIAAFLLSLPNLAVFAQDDSIRLSPAAQAVLDAQAQDETEERNPAEVPNLPKSKVEETQTSAQERLTEAAKTLDTSKAPPPDLVDAFMVRVYMKSLELETFLIAQKAMEVDAIKQILAQQEKQARPDAKMKKALEAAEAKLPILENYIKAADAKNDQKLKFLGEVAENKNKTYARHVQFLAAESLVRYQIALNAPLAGEIAVHYLKTVFNSCSSFEECAQLIIGVAAVADAATDEGLFVRSEDGSVKKLTGKAYEYIASDDFYQNIVKSFDSIGHDFLKNVLLYQLDSIRLRCSFYELSAIKSGEFAGKKLRMSREDTALIKRQADALTGKEALPILVSRSAKAQLEQKESQEKRYYLREQDLDFENLRAAVLLSKSGTVKDVASLGADDLALAQKVYDALPQPEKDYLDSTSIKIVYDLYNAYYSNQGLSLFNAMISDSGHITRALMKNNLISRNMLYNNPKIDPMAAFKALTDYWWFVELLPERHEWVQMMDSLAKAFDPDQHPFLEMNMDFSEERAGIPEILGIMRNQALQTDKQALTLASELGLTGFMMDVDEKADDETRLAAGAELAKRETMVAKRFPMFYSLTHQLVKFLTARSQLEAANQKFVCANTMKEKEEIQQNDMVDAISAVRQSAFELGCYSYWLKYSIDFNPDDYAGKNPRGIDGIDNARMAGWEGRYLKDPLDPNNKYDLNLVCGTNPETMVKKSLEFWAHEREMELDKELKFTVMSTVLGTLAMGPSSMVAGWFSTPSKIAVQNWGKRILYGNEALLKRVFYPKQSTQFIVTAEMKAKRWAVTRGTFELFIPEIAHAAVGAVAFSITNRAIMAASGLQPFYDFNNPTESKRGWARELLSGTVIFAVLPILQTRALNLLARGYGYKGPMAMEQFHRALHMEREAATKMGRWFGTNKANAMMFTRIASDTVAFATIPYGDRAIIAPLFGEKDPIWLGWENLGEELAHSFVTGAYFYNWGRLQESVLNPAYQRFQERRFAKPYFYVSTELYVRDRTSGLAEFARREPVTEENLDKYGVDRDVLRRAEIWTSADEKLSVQIIPSPKIFDLYAMLEIPRDAKPSEIDQAIALQEAVLILSKHSKEKEQDVEWQIDQQRMIDLCKALLNRNWRINYDADMLRSEKGILASMGRRYLWKFFGTKWDGEAPPAAEQTPPKEPTATE